MSEGLYVYAVIGTGEARNFGPVGIGGRGDVVTTLSYRDLSAVVSSLPMDKYVVGQETMLAHERVAEKVMKDHTVLPTRFYTVAPSAEEVRGLLRANYLEFKKLLREMDNKVELGLKALWKDLNQVLGEILADGRREVELITIPEVEATGSGVEVSKNLRFAMEKKKAKVLELLLEPLRHLAIDVRLHHTYGDDMIMNAAFLVDRTREKEFDTRIEKLVSTCSDAIIFKYVGPAPPFSFVNMVIKEWAAPRPDMQR